MLEKMNKYFKKTTDEKPRLIEEINLRFLSPDDEFRSKICQIVYEELLSVFEFSEDHIKLHSFIKTASWSYPIAIRTHESINIVNTICSIASFYDVGLEVIRTDAINPITSSKNYRTNLAISSNMVHQVSMMEDSIMNKEAKRNKLTKHNMPPVKNEQNLQGFSMKYT